MKELTEKKKLEILRSFLEGYPYDEISAKSGVAKGTVVNVMNDFRAGRLPAFRDAGDLVDTLRELSVELRRSGARVSEALLGLVFFSRLDAMGVTPQKLWLWADMCQEISPADAPVEEFMAAALEVIRLRQETGESYDSLAASCSELRAEAETLRPEVQELRSAKKELAGTNAALAEENRTLNKEKQGLESDVGQISTTREALKEEISEGEGTREALKEEVRELEGKAGALRVEVQALDGLGFTRVELETLRVKLEDIASSHGLTAEKLRAKSFRDFAEHGAIIGFQEKREKLEGEVAALETQKESLERLTSRLGAPPEEVEEAVTGLFSLKRRRVGPSAVVSYWRILSRAGVQPHELEKEILEMGGLRKTIVSLTGEVTGLEEEKRRCAAVVEALRAEETTIKATICDLSQSGRRAIEETRENALRDCRTRTTWISLPSCAAR